MADDMLEEESFADFIDTQELSLKLMAKQIKKSTGHVMTDVEAYQYLSWVSYDALNRLMFVTDDRNAEILKGILQQCAKDHYIRYVASLTGVFAPPDGKRFETVDEFTEFIGKLRGNIPTVSTETIGDYIPNGYL